MSSVSNKPIVKWLLTPPKPEILNIIIWWEIRRILYNLLMLITGIMGLIFLLIIMDLNKSESSSSEADFVPLLAVLAGGIIANICYTIGWIAEIFAYLTWKEKARYFGPILWSFGTIFSIVLCFLPGFLYILSWLACLACK
jgi:hypothetical protein